MNSYKLKKLMSAICIAFFSRQFFFRILMLYKYSLSQFNQDLYFISLMLRKKQQYDQIYFVEFGAADGILHSNTWLLEKLGGNGLLAEPCKSLYDKLVENRRSVLDPRCVHSTSGQKIFFEEMLNKQLSKISQVEKSLIRSNVQETESSYLVETVSLQDLLTDHLAPAVINYLSIDTEGSELSIIRNFDFESYQFDFISIEHNYRADRQEIHALISSKGFKRVHSKLSRCDYWYVRVGLFETTKKNVISTNDF